MTENLIRRLIQGQRQLVFLRSSVITFLLYRHGENANWDLSPLLSQLPTPFHLAVHVFPFLILRLLPQNPVVCFDNQGQG